MNQHRSLNVLIIGLIIMTINSLALPNGTLAGTDKMSPVAKQGMGGDLDGDGNNGNIRNNP